jgi:hypothetical protein
VDKIVDCLFLFDSEINRKLNGSSFFTEKVIHNKAAHLVNNPFFLLSTCLYLTLFLLDLSTEKRMPPNKLHPLVNKRKLPAYPSDWLFFQCCLFCYDVSGFEFAGINTFFIFRSNSNRGIITLCWHPVHLIRISIPIRIIFQAFVPHGCGFFI